MYQICLDRAAEDQFCRFLKLNGEQTGHVLEVEGAEATDDELTDALFTEILGMSADDEIQICR